MRNWRPNARGSELFSGIFRQPLVEPRFGEGPEAISSTAAEPQRRGGILMRKAGKIAELDELDCLRIVLAQGFQGTVECQQLVILLADLSQVKIDTLLVATSFLSSLAASAVDKNPPHGFRGCRKKVASIVPLAAGLYHPQIGFMDERRRLQRLAGSFLSEPRGR